MQNEIQILKSEIDELKNSVKSHSKTSPADVIDSGRSTFIDDDMYNEMEERQQRAYNVIISGLPESQANTTEEKIPRTSTKWLI